MEEWMRLLLNTGFAITIGVYLVREVTKVLHQQLDITHKMTETLAQLEVLIVKQGEVLDKIYEKVTEGDDKNAGN